MGRRLMALIVLDGWGVTDVETGNAVLLAPTPTMDRLVATYPYATLSASGEAVGLLDGQIGDSNVGHLNLGAGRVVYQTLVRINRAIRDSSVSRNETLRGAMERARSPGVSLHLLGLVSDGGVHSHTDHLFALIDLAAKHGVKRLFVHGFLDGRDVPPASAEPYLRAVEEKLAQAGIGKIATVMGRYFAMDRDKRWNRTEKAYRAMVHGEGEPCFSAIEALRAAYARGETDEFVTPAVMVDESRRPVGRISDGDVVIFFNFRADRARQITRAFTAPGFAEFPPEVRRPEVAFICLTEYDRDFDLPVVFRPEPLVNTLGEVVSKRGLKQLRLAETEKYAHVTFFFSGGREELYPGEERRLIPSPKVATYDQCPEMSAFEVTAVAKEEIRARRFDFLVLNYANPDMVGHTGVLAAAKKAVAVVDRCLREVLEAVLEVGGAAVVVSDHGNIEQMVDYETGEPHTAHTTNPVPCVVVDPRRRSGKLRQGGILADVAPTLLEMMGIARPAEMTGESLFANQGGEACGRDNRDSRAGDP